MYSQRVEFDDSVGSLPKSDGRPFYGRLVAASKESHEVKVPLVTSSYDRGTGLTNLSYIHHTFHFRH